MHKCVRVHNNFKSEDLILKQKVKVIPVKVTFLTTLYVGKPKMVI